MDSLPALQPDYEGGSDPAGEAMEWVKSRRSEGKDPLAEITDGELESEESGSGEHSAEPASRETNPIPEEKPAVSRPEDKPRPQALANFHRQQREFEAQRQAFASEKKELESIKQTLENAKVDRLAALEAMGYKDVKSFLEGIVEDGGRMTPERREIQELKQWKAQQEKQREEAENQHRTAQEQQRIHQQLDVIRRDVQDKIKSETYANRLVNIDGADEQIMQEMDKMAAATGELPRIEDAIEAVESRFRENLKSLSGNPVVRSFFQDLFKSPNSAPSPSKSKGKLTTIGSEVRSPGVAKTEEYVPSVNGEREIEEALAWLNKKKRAR